MPDGDAADVLQLDAGPLEETLDRRHHVVVPADAGEPRRPDDLPFGAERDRGLFGRGVDTQDDHDASPPGRSSTARAAARAVPSREPRPALGP